jgi:DNA invertase Pin-like site-specific DNA recombinase
MKVKYIRWSTLGQTGARQLLDADKYDLVLQEQVSGSVAFAKRLKGAELLKLINQGKVTDLYIEELTRLGRNSFDMLTTLNACEENHVIVHIQNMNLSSSVKGKPNPLFKMFTHIMSVMSEHEKELIKERTEMGKIAARQRGVTFGRKPGTNERKADFLQKDASKKILKYLKAGEYPIRVIAKLTNSSTATVVKVKRIGLETKALLAK